MPPQILFCLAKDCPRKIDTQLCSEQMSTQAADDSEIHVIIERVAIIEHNHGPSTRSEHPMNLADGEGSIGRVVKHSMGINEIKGTVREGQVLSIALHELSFEICQLKTSSRYTQRCVRQVDRGVMGAGANKPFGLAAASATDFEHPEAASVFKANR